MVEQVFKSFKSRYVYLSYEEHDLVTANTQAVTHAAFLRYVFTLPLPSRIKEAPLSIPSHIRETSPERAQRLTCQYGHGMAQVRRLPLGNRTLRIRYRSHQSKHHTPDLRCQMARLCRTGITEPIGPNSDPAVCDIDDGVVQVDGGR